GFKVGGFDAAVTSDVLNGSGLSSSAAFEVLIGAILDTLYNQSSMDPILRAKIAQYAENVHFGKPSGLMDQMASSLGGMIAIDFKTDEVSIEPLHFSFEASGYSIVVVGTGGSHDDLTSDYAAIREEMTAVANYFGVDTLRSLRPELFSQNIAALRDEFSDRAVLRAMHYYAENDRVSLAVEALQAFDLETFFSQINLSGKSSWHLLQNVSVSAHEQPLALALAMADVILAGRGASRVHGGGFAGTTLNFVPIDLLERFVLDIETVFGKGSCHILDVRQDGAVSVFQH
ncbi:MAG: galactokinase, partial [Clostridiales bacterium]|nr:galactokinase [Clostridiales bacterium]